MKPPPRVTSPWRYPGGKTRLAAGILPLIPPDMTDYCEPFVGGGGVTLPALGRIPDGAKVALNDADPRVAAWWQVLTGGREAFGGLLSMIEGTEPTVEMFNHIQKWGLDPVNVQLFRAFAGIFLNRCAYSGILSGGPIGGQGQLSQYGVGCRYNRPKLRKNHEAVYALLARHEVTATALDFRHVMKAAAADAFIYADPPYRAKGAALYPAEFTEDDHEDLARLLQDHPGQWVLSYDDHPWVRERYADCLIEPVFTHYTVTSQRPERIRGSELLIRPRR